MCSYFPKEMLKQLDTDYRPCLTKNWDFVPKEMKLVTTLDKFKAKSRLKVRKMSLPTLQNLPSTDRLHYVMPIKCRRDMCQH